MTHMIVTLGKRQFVIQEPVFGSLKQIIPLLNRLARADKQPDKAVLNDMAQLLALLLGDGVKSLRGFNRPSAEQLAALLQQLPDFLGLTEEPGTAAGLTAVDDSWDALYCTVTDRTGWTFAEIDNNLTLSRLAAFNRHWQHNPPTNALVAAYMGYQYEEPDAGLKALINQLKAANNG